MNERQKIGLFIKRRRQLLDMSQEELAHKVGYKARTSVNKIEKGNCDIPPQKIKAFATALNCNIEDLIPQGQTPSTQENNMNDILDIIAQCNNMDDIKNVTSQYSDVIMWLQEAIKKPQIYELINSLKKETTTDYYKSVSEKLEKSKNLTTLQQEQLLKELLNIMKKYGLD